MKKGRPVKAAPHHLRRIRAFSGSIETYRDRAREYIDSAGLTGRAKNSVEVLLAQF
jgi:hypothetical protein